MKQRESGHGIHWGDSDGISDSDASIGNYGSIDESIYKCIQNWKQTQSG